MMGMPSRIIIDRTVRAAHAARAVTIIIGTSATQILEGNSRRQSIYIANPTNAVPVWVSIESTLSIGAGIRIGAGDTWVVSTPQDTIIPQYPWYAIAGAAGTPIHIITVELAGLTPFSRGVSDAEQWANVSTFGDIYSRRRANQIG